MNKQDKIKDWILNTIEDESWKTYNDLHIDTVSPSFKSKENWITGGIQCYHIANDFINRNSIPFILELSIALKSKKKDKDYCINNWKDVAKDLTQTPPSLYIYKSDWGDLKNMFKKSILLKDIGLNIEDGLAYYCQTFNSDDNEIRRSFFISNKNAPTS